MKIVYRMMVCCFATLCIIHGNARSVIAQAIAQPTATLNEAFRNYCGIYCVYLASRLQHLPVKFSELVDNRYVGSPQGSSLKELADAATNLGLENNPYTFTTVDYIRSHSKRAILHVKSGPESIKADHWVLFVGEQTSELALIFDPSSMKLVSVPWLELVARWDRTALVFSEGTSSSNTIRLMIMAIIPCCCIGIMIFLISLICNERKSYAHSSQFSFGVLVGLIGISVLVATGFHVISRDGLLRGRSGVEFVHRSHQLSVDNRGGA